MNRFIQVLILWLAGCWTAGFAQTTEDLREQLRTFNQAFARADTGLLSSMITSNYSHINGNSRPYTKQEWLSYVAGQHKKLQGERLVIDQYEMTEIAIDNYGHSAVVTGLVSNAGTENGQPFSKRFRVTHLWIVENERWKRAAFHDGAINK